MLLVSLSSHIVPELINISSSKKLEENSLPFINRLMKAGLVVVKAFFSGVIEDFFRRFNYLRRAISDLAGVSFL